MTAPTMPAPPTAQPMMGGAAPAAGPSGLAQSAHVIATVLAGLSAGFFYAYESSVIRGLAEVDDLTYVQTFQAINDTIRNPLFGLVFFGSLPMLLIASALHRGRRWTVQRTLLVLAPVLYVVGMAITVTGNVPLNDELADVEASTVTIASEARDAFEDDWNRWNDYRSLSFVGAFAASAAALPLAGRTGRK